MRCRFETSAFPQLLYLGCGRRRSFQAALRPEAATSISSDLWPETVGPQAGRHAVVLQPLPCIVQAVPSPGLSWHHRPRSHSSASQAGPCAFAGGGVTSPATMVPPMPPTARTRGVPGLSPGFSGFGKRGPCLPPLGCVLDLYFDNRIRGKTWKDGVPQGCSERCSGWRRALPPKGLAKSRTTVRAERKLAAASPGRGLAPRRVLESTYRRAAWPLASASARSQATASTNRLFLASPKMGSSPVSVGRSRMNGRTA